MKLPSILRLSLALAVLSLMVLAQSCTSNDKSGAGVEPKFAGPAPATMPPPSGNPPPVERASDPAANGGSDLPPSAPYSQASTQQQNINPAPFMVGVEREQSGGSGTAPSGLTSRADGTMSGPNDQPPATTGWGTAGPQAVPAATGAKPSKAPPK